jgi:WD40 repeat protein
VVYILLREHEIDDVVKALFNEGTIIDAATELRILLDGRSFPISISTPHLYVSALAWLPKSSKLFRAAEVEFANSNVLSRPITQPSPFLLEMSMTRDIGSLAVSPDGWHIASGSSHGVIQIWDLQTGTRVGEEMTANGSRVNALAFSPDGSTIASGSWYESCIHMWDVEARRARGAGLYGHTDGLSDLSFSPHGRLLASTSYDQSIRLWDLADHHCLREIKLSSDEVYSAVFSPDNGYLTIATNNGLIHTWNVNDAAQVEQPLVGHEGLVRSVAYSVDGARIASGSVDGTIRLWDTKTRQQSGDPLKVGSWVTSVAFSPDGNYLASGNGKFICVWDLASFSLVGQYESQALRVAFSPDGNRIISTSHRSITVVDTHKEIPNPEQLMSDSYGMHLLCAWMSSDKSRIVSISNNGIIQKWDIRNGTHQEDAAPIDQRRLDIQVRSAVFSSDGRSIAIVDECGKARLYDTEACHVLHNLLQESTEEIECCGFSRDGQQLATGSVNGYIRIWDTSTGICTHGPLGCHTHAISSVVFSPNGTVVAFGSEGASVRFWNMESGSVLGGPFIELDDPDCDYSFSPDGCFLASGSYDESVLVCDIRTGKFVCDPPRGNGGGITATSFSRDGGLVFSGSVHGTVEAWRLHSNLPVGQPLRGHSGEINYMALSHDGSQIITTSSDKSIRVWDSESFFWIPAPNLCGCEVRGPRNIPTNISDDGWIRSRDGALLLWAPARYRNALTSQCLLCISTKDEDRRINIIWEKLCHGTDWTRIWTP